MAMNRDNEDRSSAVIEDDYTQQRIGMTLTAAKL